MELRANHHQKLRTANNPIHWDDKGSKKRKNLSQMHLGNYNLSENHETWETVILTPKGRKSKAGIQLLEFILKINTPIIQIDATTKKVLKVCRKTGYETYISGRCQLAKEINCSPRCAWTAIQLLKQLKLIHTEIVYLLNFNQEVGQLLYTRPENIAKISGWDSEKQKITKSILLKEEENVSKTKKEKTKGRAVWNEERRKQLHLHWEN